MNTLFAIRRIKYMMSFVMITRLFLAAGASWAQDKLEEPQYIGHFDELLAGRLIELEPEKIEVQSHNTNYHFMVTNKSEYDVAGAASPVRVVPDARFVVRIVAKENIDPNTFISLYKFVVRKNQRTIPNSAGHGSILGSKSDAVVVTTISLTFKSYGQSSLEIAPAQPLNPGEYAFVAPGVASAYCFGVD